jgi:predicted AAA+ superfamily ATPase
MGFGEEHAVAGLIPALKAIIDESTQRNGRFLILRSAHPGLLRSVSETLTRRVDFCELDSLIAEEVAPRTPRVELKDLLIRGGYPSALGDAVAESRFA